MTKDDWIGVVSVIAIIASLGLIVMLSKSLEKDVPRENAQYVQSIRSAATFAASDDRLIIMGRSACQDFSFYMTSNQVMESISLEFGVSKAMAAIVITHAVPNFCPQFRKSL